MQRKNIDPLVILGSSRSHGNTRQAFHEVLQDSHIPIIDLKTLQIAPYDYAYANAHDDFMPLAEKMMQYNPLILATPVYWYTMSALMKTFIDRWSDLVRIRKDLGRRLAGKDLFIISSYGDSIPRGFEDAFIQTCTYLDMCYQGCYYFYSGEDVAVVQENTTLAKKFAARIFA